VAPRCPGARTDVRADAAEPAATAVLSKHARSPVGGASGRRPRAGRELRASGWTVRAARIPKSKAAKLGTTGARTTWFPGYWMNDEDAERDEPRRSPRGLASSVMRTGEAEAGATVDRLGP
jgi:hypothetical protein